MKLFGLAGWSGSGKTTLLIRLIPELVGRGVSVSTVKHAHHDFDIDHPGKDSHRHREAGASEVLVSSARRWALVHEHRGAPEPGLDDLLRHLSPVDLVILEGFKRHDHAKLEVWRLATGKPQLHPDDPAIIGIVTDRPDLLTTALPVMALDDIAGVADFIMTRAGLQKGLRWPS